MYGPPPYQPPPRTGMPGPAVAAVAVMCLLVGGFAGCMVGMAGSTPPPEKRPAAATASEHATEEPAPGPAQTASPTGTPSPPPSSTPAKVKVPDVVGANHQEAQNTMQAAGLYMLMEEDATGQGRMLVLDRNWVVERQSPKAGSRVAPDTMITLYSKKIGE